ncbi:MAG: hypothetical protein AB7U59_14465 [Desulfovibrionaceae bacterium]
MPRLIDAETPQSRRLAQAAKVTETVISRELYRTGSLRADCERLSQPSEPMTDADILSFVLKYFHASLYPGSENHAVPLAEASGLLRRFYDLWLDGGERDVPLPGEYSAYPLRMLADLPRTAHIFRSVANRALAPGLRPERYLGFDLGTGSGIILTAAWFQAMRNKIHDPELVGVECDGEVAERTRLLFESLGLGRIVVDDARDAGVLAALPDGPLAFVGNENVPAPKTRVTAEPFSAIHAALFSVMAKRLRQTIFFPEALVVRDRDAEIDVVLSKNNRFQPPRHYRSLRLRPRSIVIEGRLTKLWEVGKDFRQYLPESWLRIMPGRW